MSGKFPPPGWATETPHPALALEVRRGDQVLRRHELRPGGGRRCFIIGRQPGVADVLVTDDEAVSRQHAAIVPRGDKLYIIDLKSLRGTFVNNARIKPNEPVQLAPGAAIALSDAPPYKLVVVGLVVAPAAPAAVAAARSASAAAAPADQQRWQPPKWSVVPSVPVSVELVRGGEWLQTVDIGRKRAYVLGRSAQQADLPIAHESVSRQHAALVHALHGEGGAPSLHIVDLGSIKGTYLELPGGAGGWKRLQPNVPVALPPGGRVRLGDCSTLITRPGQLTLSGLSAEVTAAMIGPAGPPVAARAAEPDGPRFSSLMTTTMLRTSVADDVAAARRAQESLLPFPEQVLYTYFIYVYIIYIHTHIHI